MPYAFLRVLERKEPYLDKEKRMPKEQAKFLLENSNMKGHYLGACLDSCRWGSYTTVMWEMDVKGMVSFIQNWMQQNNGNFERLWHERRIDELYTKFELPYTHHEACPRDKEHKGTVVDLGGRMRCAHKTEKRFKPGFIVDYEYFDELSQTMRTDFYENKPRLDLTDGAWDEKTGEILPGNKKELDNYEKQLKRFKEKDRTEIIDDVCYAILSDKAILLSLETIIKRLNLRPEFDTEYCNMPEYAYRAECNKISELNEEEKELYKLTTLCPGHMVPHNKIEFPFDGWDTAFYAQRWFEQFEDKNRLLFFEGF